MREDKGIIIRGIGGFYYVKTTNKIYECKLRGKFRKDKISPVAGDIVTILIDDNQSELYASIEKIHGRKNYFIRPPISNIDKLFIVSSTCDPKPNTVLIDEMIVIAYSFGVEPILIISKTDLKDYTWLRDIYLKAGIKTILFSKEDFSGIDIIKENLKGSVSAFTGNSGVGKSTILNLIDKKFNLKTGITSKKLGRGKHTTRHVELLPLRFGGFVADTPGFSKIDLLNFLSLKKENLITFFKDLEEFSCNCKFSSCSHTCEKGCSVIEALNIGRVERSRYNSYLLIYKKIMENENKY